MNEELGQDELQIKEQTEVGQAFENLDNDSVDKSTGMSNIDLNTRLSREEIRCVTVIDEFSRLGILPEELSITRQTKRLSVSVDGKGREEKVRIASGSLERKNAGMLGGLFRRREKIE